MYLVSAFTGDVLFCFLIHCLTSVNLFLCYSFVGGGKGHVSVFAIAMLMRGVNYGSTLLILDLRLRQGKGLF